MSNSAAWDKRNADICRGVHRESKELSPAVIRRMREAYADGVTKDQLVSRFGVHHNRVSELVKGVVRGV